MDRMIGVVGRRDHVTPTDGAEVEDGWISIFATEEDTC